MKLIKKDMLINTLIFKSVIFIYLLTFLTNTVNAATVNSRLVWSDEFNGNSLDTTIWTAEIGTDAAKSNSELEYYTNRVENLSVYDGLLHITAKNESYDESNYTSARIKTKDKFYFTFGHVEARIALPLGMGIWPAYWLLEEDIKFPNKIISNEIDLIETVNTENIVYGTCHGKKNGQLKSYSSNIKSLDITDFHVYVFDWDEQFIRMYVDGKKYYELNISSDSSYFDNFKNNMYFILNVAVGGLWPGYNIDNSAFPHTMMVDYIRVYQDVSRFNYSFYNN